MSRLPLHIIGRRIKAALALIDEDATWLAAQMGVSRGGLSGKMAAGRLGPEELTEIARLTGVSVDWLRGGGPSITNLVDATAPTASHGAGEIPAAEVLAATKAAGRRGQAGR